MKSTATSTRASISLPLLVVSAALGCATGQGASDDPDADWVPATGQDAATTADVVGFDVVSPLADAGSTLDVATAPDVPAVDAGIPDPDVVVTDTPDVPAS